MTKCDGEKEILELIDLGKAIADTIEQDIRRQFRLGQGFVCNMRDTEFAVAGTFRPLETALAVIETIHNFSEKVLPSNDT